MRKRREKGDGDGAYFRSSFYTTEICVGGRAERARGKSRIRYRESGRRPKFVESLGDFSQDVAAYDGISKSTHWQDQAIFPRAENIRRTFTNPDLISWK